MIESGMELGDIMETVTGMLSPFPIYSIILTSVCRTG